MGFNFTDQKSWKNTFDPAENGVSDSFRNAGKTLETNLDPTKNGVSNAFNEQFSDEVWNPEKNGVFSFLNSFSDSIGGLFSDAAGRTPKRRGRNHYNATHWRRNLTRYHFNG
jgi:hypothetical protein